MTTALAREALQQMVQNLPDDKVMIVVDFMRRLKGNADPFYSEGNMRHLRAVKADADAGRMSAHNLIETADA
jgi:hypothetical protein